MARKTYLKEEEVSEAIVEWLSRKSYSRHLRVKGTGKQGTDIRVMHNKYARYFIVEAKGDANPKTVKFPNSNREVKFLQVVGQIVTRMKTKSKDHYALGVPSTYESKVKKRLPWLFCKNNNLQVLLVSLQEKVKPCTWRDLKAAQSK